MDKLISGSRRQFRKSDESSLKQSVTAKSLIRSPISTVKSLNSRGERVHRTLSKISKASSWIGGISADKKAEQMFSRLHTHVKGYPIASIQSPPNVMITPLTRKVMALKEVKVKGTVSVKRYKEQPRMMNVRVMNAKMSLKSGKKKAVQKKLSRNMDITMSGTSPRLKSHRAPSAVFTDEISFSRFYDISYKPSRPLQFKLRFYEAGDSFSPKFLAYSIRLESIEECHEWLRTMIASIKQMHDFLKRMINTYVSDNPEEAKYNTDMCDRYAKCLLDLTFWLYGYNSTQSVDNIELYEKFLMKTDFSEEALIAWKEKKVDIMQSIETEPNNCEGALSIVETIRNEIVKS